MSYSLFTSLLTGASGELLLRCVVIALLAVGFAGLGLWLPFVRGERSPRSLALAGALAMGAGVAVAIICWTLSLFAFEATWPGTVIAVITAIAGTRAVKDRILVERRHLGVLITATLVAGGLGLWHFGCSELPSAAGAFGSEQAGELYLFSDRHRDLPVHVHMASLIANTGLPRISTYGLPGEGFHPLVHSGYAVLIVGTSQTTGLSLYASASCLWVLAYVVIVQATVALVSRLGATSIVIFVAAIAPLIWGSLRQPPFKYFWHDPDAARPFAPIPLPAGAMYHNFSQAWSIALMAVGLVWFDRFARRGQRPLRDLAVVCAFIVVSGWVKPSLAILFGPALLIVLAIGRRRIPELGVALAVFAAGALIYFLPALLETLPSEQPWTFNDEWRRARRMLRWGALAAGVAVLVVVLRTVTAAMRRESRDFDWGDLTALACGGGVLFAALFREQRLDGAQPNLLWGASATIALLAPYVIAWCGGASELTARIRAPRWLRWGAWLAVAVQLLSGGLYAIKYPTMNVRGIPVAAARTLAVAGSATTPRSKFLLDPSLADLDAVSYLERPVLYGTLMLDEVGSNELRAWTSFVESGVMVSPLQFAARDAIVLHGNRRAAGATLNRIGWRRVELDLNGYELWVDGSRTNVLIEER